MSRATAVTNLHEAAAQSTIKRSRHTFKVPVTLQAEVAAESIVIVELTAEEEMMATRRSRGDQVRLAWELAKESLRRVDDQEVKSADGSIDSVWNRMHPKLRQMVIGAYSAVHSPNNEQQVDFLGSRQIEVG